MQVEVYLTEDFKDLETMDLSTIENVDTPIIPLTEEWESLVAALNLEGQQQLVEHKTSRMPFQRLTLAEIAVYSQILPTHVEAKAYNWDRIPVRVLGLMQIAARLECFDKGMEIWYDREKPDPILVGAAQDPSTSWQKIYYIVARWGAELDSFVQLKAKAIASYIAERRQILEPGIERAKMELKMLEINATARFENGETIREVSIYGG